VESLRNLSQNVGFPRLSRDHEAKQYTKDHQTYSPNDAQAHARRRDLAVAVTPAVRRERVTTAVLISTFAGPWLLPGCWALALIDVARETHWAADFRACDTACCSVLVPMQSVVQVPNILRDDPLEPCASYWISNCTRSYASDERAGRLFVGCRFGWLPCQLSCGVPCMFNCMFCLVTTYMSVSRGRTLGRTR
jgi:hypothetical protein